MFLLYFKNKNKHHPTKNNFMLEYIEYNFIPFSMKVLMQKT